MPRIARRERPTPGRHPAASTGPRHRCRGSDAGRRLHRRGRIASTGPRHRCRGSAALLSAHDVGPGASTGPRHRCRGSKTPSTESPTASNLLQRGLGIDAEDRKRPLPREPLAPIASTGPRHRCRGSGLDTPERTVGDVASTGPRHRCRGSPLRRASPPPRSGRFNGASASMPRIGPNQFSTDRAIRQASTGPRHRCRGSMALLRKEDGDIAASTGPRHRCRGSVEHGQRAAEGPLASTGPRHRCRGSDVLRKPAQRPYEVLQRGLGIDAEDRRKSRAPFGVD